MKTPSPNARDRGLRRLRQLTLAFGGGSLAALASAAYVAAVTIPGSTVATTQVAAVGTPEPAATPTTATTADPTPAATPVPTPTPTASSKPVAVSGGSR